MGYSDLTTIDARQDPVLRKLRRQDRINKSLINKRIKYLQMSETIESCIASKFNISKDALMTKCRRNEFIFAKHIYRYFLAQLSKEGELISECRRNTDVKFRYSLQKIGLITGCDHATILSSIKVVNNLFDTDKIIRSKIIEIRSQIMNNKVRFPEI